MDYEKIGEHSYLDLVSSIPYEERILEEAESNRVFEGLEDFLLTKYSLSEKVAMQKAEDILKGTNKASDYRPHINNNSRKKLIDEALAEGFITDFNLREPWHPQVCMDPEEFTSYPHQHTTAILYTAQEKHLFFSRKGKKDILEEEDFNQFYNPESILDQGFIRPGNRHEGEEEGHMKEGVYLATMNHASMGYQNPSESVRNLNLYNKRLVFEIQVPTKWLIIDDVARSWTDLSSLEELSRQFGSPEGFRKYFEDSHYTEFKVSINPGIPLKYIRGVWDMEKFSEPKFMPLKEYYRHIHAEFPERVPDNPEKIDVSASSKKGRKEFKYFREHWGKIRKLMQLFVGDSTQKEGLGIITALEYMENRNLGIPLKAYNHNVKKAQKYLSEELGVEAQGTQNPPITSREELYQDLPQLEENVKQIFGEMKTFREEIVSDLREEQNPSRQEIEYAIQKQQKLEKDLSKIHSLPYVKLE